MHTALEKFIRITGEGGGLILSYKLREFFNLTIAMERVNNHLRAAFFEADIFKDSLTLRCQ